MLKRFHFFHAVHTANILDLSWLLFDLLFKLNIWIQTNLIQILVCVCRMLILCFYFFSDYKRLDGFKSNSFAFICYIALMQIWFLLIRSLKRQEGADSDLLRVCLYQISRIRFLLFIQTTKWIWLWIQMFSFLWSEEQNLILRTWWKPHTAPTLIHLLVCSLISKIPHSRNPFFYADMARNCICSACLNKATDLGFVWDLDWCICAAVI